MITHNPSHLAPLISAYWQHEPRDGRNKYIQEDFRIGQPVGRRGLNSDLMTGVPWIGVYNGSWQKTRDTELQIPPSVFDVASNLD